MTEPGLNHSIAPIADAEHIERHRTDRERALLD